VLDRPTSKFIAPRALLPADIALFGADHETYTYDLGYNAVGRLASWKSFGAANAATPTLQSEHQYTAAGQSSWQKQTTNAAGYSGLQRTVFSRYHISGELSDTFFYDVVGTNNCQNGSMAAYWYDARGLPLQVQIQNCVYGPTTSSYLTNARNVAGLVTRRYSIAGNAPITNVESNWGYDTLGRVTSQIVNKGSPSEQVARQEHLLR
jgi:hypothetical protein